MRILSFNTIYGPNVYHDLPVITMKVDIGEYADLASNEIPEFSEKLLTLFPGLNEHTCSLGYRGGFCERLGRGTYMAHIIEHVALELIGLAGEKIAFGKTRYAGSKGCYLIVTRFENEAGMKRALETAFEGVIALLANNSFDLSEAVYQIKSEIERTKLGPSAQAIFDAAKARDIPVRRLGFTSLLQLGYGNKTCRVQTAVTDRTSLIAADIVQDKFQTKEILRAHAIRVPKGLVVKSEAELKEAIQKNFGPYVIKPLDGHHGQGVSLEISNEEEALRAFRCAKQYSGSVIVEEMCYGRDYRVLVINGKFSAASERRPPVIFGNGKMTISELIAATNDDPRRGEGHACELTKIEVDEVVIETVQKQGWTLSDVPPAGQCIFLRYNANLSSGGTARDVSDEVHPQIKSICQRVAAIIRLDICGIDIIHDDISKPADENFNIIEVNAGPGLRMHLAPSEGRPRPVADDIIEMLYPDGGSSRIPIVAITGTNGKTTTTRLVSKIFSDEYDCVGLTTSDGVWIGQDKILEGDTTGPQSSQIVLSDPLVDVAVLELARGGILRGGLSYDWSDVGIVTNIRPDHLGQDGIEDIEDLVWIKSLIAERVRQGGTLVLNADDFESLRLRDREKVKNTDKNIFLYSVEATNLELVHHRQKGGSACWLEKGCIHVSHKTDRASVAAVKEIPFTAFGMASFQISNALAAVAAGVAMKIPFEKIARALRGFDSNGENLGRFNIYKVGAGYVILDYGHNTDAFEAMGKLVAKFKDYKTTAILGLPGDRTDKILKHATAMVAEYFDNIILREDQDLRGRQPGALVHLMEGVVVEHPRRPTYKKIFNEIQAVNQTLAQIQENEIVVIFYESLDSVLKTIRQFDPVPAHLPVPQPSKPREEIFLHGSDFKETEETVAK